MRPMIFALMLLVLVACGSTAAANSPTPNPVAVGSRIFTIQCGACHTISDVGADTLGPRLSAMVARAKAHPDPAVWLRLAITNPTAETAPGYQLVMPISYGQSLSPAQIDALVTYMLKVGG